MEPKQTTIQGYTRIHELAPWSPFNLMVLESPRSSVSPPPTFHPRTRKQNSLESHQMPLQHTCTGQHGTSSRTRITAFWECRKLLHIQSCSIMVCKIRPHGFLLFVHRILILFWPRCKFPWLSAVKYRIPAPNDSLCLMHWCWCKVCWSSSFRTQDFSRALVGTFFLSTLSQVQVHYQKRDLDPGFTETPATRRTSWNAFRQEMLAYAC